MARTYATEDDYRDWSGDITAAPAPAVLRAASARLDRALIGFVYETNPATGLPVDPEVIEAFQEATCALVAYWDEIGDTTGSGAGAAYAEAQIGSASYKRAGSGTAGGGEAPQGLPGPVVDILRAAGVSAVQTPYVYG